MDHQDRTLESMQMFARPNPSAVQAPPNKRRRISQDEGGDGETAINLDSDGEVVGDAKEDSQMENRVNVHTVIEESQVSLKSVKQLRLEIAKKGSAGEVCRFTIHSLRMSSETENIQIP